jgi:TolB protein
VVRALVSLSLVFLTTACGGTFGGLGSDAQLFVISADGKEVRQLTEDEASHDSVAWSPNGREIAFVSSRPGGSAIEIMRADGRARHEVLRDVQFGEAGLSWSPDGTRLAFEKFQDDSLRYWVEVVQARSPHRRRVVATYVLNRVLPLGPVWSRNGELAYARPLRNRPLKVVLADPAGRQQRKAATGSEVEFDPRWSPHGDSILFTREQSNTYTLVVARGSTATAATPALIDVVAEWSPDGRKIAFAGVAIRGDRRYHLWIVDLARRRPVSFPGEVATVRPSWSPDGGRVAFATYEGLAVADLRSQSVRMLKRLPHDSEIGEVAWSPDGRLVAFTAMHSPPSD